MYRIELVSNSQGALILDKDEPLDIQKLAINIKRSEKRQGIVYTILLNMEFIEYGRNYLQQAFETAGGVDAKVALNIYERSDDDRQWFLRLESTVNFESYDLGEITLIINADQNNFQMLLDAFGDVDVNLETVVAQDGSDLPAQPAKVITLHSKTILLQDHTVPDTYLPFLQGSVFTFDIPSGVGNVNRDNVVYMELSNSGEVEGVTRAEIEDSFSQPFEFVDFAGSLDNGFVAGTYPDYSAFLGLPGMKATRFPKVTFKRAGKTKVDLKVDLQFTIESELGGVTPSHVPEAMMWFEHRDKLGNVITLFAIGTWGGWVYTTPGGRARGVSVRAQQIYQDSNIDVNAGDSFYVYGTMRVYGNFAEHIGGDTFNYDCQVQSFDGSFINIEQQSIAPISTSRSVLMFEAFQRCIQYITGQTNSFKSTLLGRTDLGYDVDGKYSLIAYTNGDNLRNKKNLATGGVLPIFATLNELYNFINMITPCCIVFEKNEDGTPLCVLESIEYAYDKNLIAVDLGPVEGVRKKVNKDRYYNQIEIGYTTKMDVSEVNAIDEFNTLRKFKIPVANSKNILTVTTPLVASGYIIETQRRFSNSTKDSKYDTNRFVISVVRDGDNFKSRKTEGYTQVLNVFDPDTVYNIDLTPTQCLQNWFPILASNLIYAMVDKIIAFSYGEYNYNLVTKKALANAISESGQFDITLITPLYDCLDYVLSAPLDLNQLSLIELNSKGVVQFQDVHGNTMNGFISKEGIAYKSEDISEFTLIKSK